MNGKLILKNGKKFLGKSFGATRSISGEMVFATGMVGYPESITDPSFYGQILVLTYPIIGNYGIPSKKYFESKGIQISGLVVSNYIDTPSHFQSRQTLSSWLISENVPGLEVADTRQIAQHLRDNGSTLGKIILKQNVDWYDPNIENVIDKVSTKKVYSEGSGSLHFLLIDCGLKRNIVNSLVKRNIKVTVVPWDHNPFNEGSKFDGVVISNGPGDPKMAKETIETVKVVMNKKIPILGVCLGNQILALAAGGDTKKLKFGHRSQNQPCVMEPTQRCFITTQNHGFAVSKIPAGFKEWFTNANDGSNEGIIHSKYPFMSVQFHPEATPGPTDCDFIFDDYIARVKSGK